MRVYQFHHLGIPNKRAIAYFNRAFAKSKMWAWMTLILLLGLATGCRPQMEDVERAQKAGILLRGNGTEPETLDPHVATGVPENQLISCLIEGLIAYHPTDDTAIEYGMAERFVTNETGDVYTFFLRDAKWSNGDSVSAWDFDYSYRRILTPELGAEYVSMLFVIKNAQSYYESRVTPRPGEEPLPWEEVGLKVLDDKILQITLTGPMPHFPLMLKHYSWFPVNPRTIEEHGGMTSRNGRWFSVDNFVGNGPFRLKSWRTNQILEVEKNPDYWDAEEVKLNGIRFFPVESVDTERRMFEAGQLHITGSVPMHEIPIYRKESPHLIRTDPYLGTYYYRINLTREGPLQDARVRRALALSIDRASLIDNVLKGGQAPAHFFVPRGILGYPANDFLRYDPAEAQRLMAEAGYPNGRDFPVVEILYNTREEHKTIAEAIQQMWKLTLGIDLTLHNQEWKVYLDSQSNFEYEIARAGWIGDFVDPYTFLELFTTGNGNNQTGWSNERYDALIARSIRTGQRAERFALLEEAESILMEELPILPLYIYTRTILLHPTVKNWNPKLLDNRNMKYIYLKVATPKPQPSNLY